MEREIKFRAWHKADNQMLDWSTLHQSAWNTFRGDKPLSLIYEILVARKDDFFVMQYTGLKDKNGKEIYEGDIDKCGYIIKYCNIKGLFAQFGKKWGGVDGNIDDYDRIMTYPIQAQEIEIIGNIYENPELLK